MSTRTHFEAYIRWSSRFSVSYLGSLKESLSHQLIDQTPFQRRRLPTKDAAYFPAWDMVKVAAVDREANRLHLVNSAIIDPARNVYETGINWHCVGLRDRAGR